MAIVNDVRVFHITVEIMDFEQEIGRVAFYLRANMGTDDAGMPLTTFAQLETFVEACETDILAVSNGGHCRHTISWSKFYTRNAPSQTGAYPNVEDKLTLSFQDVDGRTVQLNIPAPIDSSLIADKETVNMADTHVSALAEKWTTVATAPPAIDVVSSAGSQIQELSYGRRNRKPGRNERAGRFPAIG